MLIEEKRPLCDKIPKHFYYRVGKFEGGGMAELVTHPTTDPKVRGLNLDTTNIEIELLSILASSGIQT